MTALSSFFNWCFKKGLRQKKIENLSTQLLTKKLRHQRTQRMAFSKEEYKFLVKTSQLRFKQGRSKRIRFERERLHHFIIFMVGTGLRVDEALGLEWNDIRAVDRNKINDPNNSFGNDFLSELERYYLEINVSQSKTNERRHEGNAKHALFKNYEESKNEINELTSENSAEECTQMLNSACEKISHRHKNQ